LDNGERFATYARPTRDHRGVRLAGGQPDPGASSNMCFRRTR
jgi:hypothetical protein